MKILSLNVNGLRAFINNERALAIEKYFDWDVICFQEIKCDHEICEKLCDTYFPHLVFSNSSQFKSGYAGVATLVDRELYDSQVVTISGPEIMKDYGSGRLIVTEFREFILVNVYTLNSGNKEPERREWDVEFYKLIQTLDSIKPVVIVGDLNVVAGELDHHNYQRAFNTMPGLYDFELEAFTKLCSELDLIDAYRFRNPGIRSYSWFSYMGQARKKNLGWRIDYTLVSKRFFDRVKSTKVLTEVYASDHCPVLIEISDE